MEAITSFPFFKRINRLYKCLQVTRVHQERDKPVQESHIITTKIPHHLVRAFMFLTTCQMHAYLLYLKFQTYRVEVRLWAA